jgi:hypothetical protein
MAVGNPRRSWVVVPVVAAVAFLLSSGCGSGGSQLPPTSSSWSSMSTSASSSVTASQDPKEAAASEAAVTAYLGYVKAFAAASQIPDPDYPDLARYLNQPLLSRTRHTLRLMRDKGVVQVGAQTATVTGTSVDLASDQPSVTIHSCLDYSALRLVYQASRSPVPDSQLTKTKVPAIVTVWLFVNGRWMVIESKDGTGSC